MSSIRTAAVVWAILGAGACRADVSSVRSLLESVLSAQNEDRLPRPPDVAGQMEADVRAATTEQVESLLPLAESCLRSPRLLARGYGILLFTIVTFRPDSSKLMQPYIDADLAPLLDAAEVGLKNGAIFILGGTNPAPSPKAVAYLASHLNDQTNSAEQTRMIAAALLKSLDSVYIHKVLDLVEGRPGLSLRGDVIQMLGHYRITTEEALKFVRGGLRDPSQGVRRVSLEAIGSMSKDVRNGFVPEIQHVVSDPNEIPEIRSLAERVLVQ